MIKQIGLPLRGRPILLITRIITDRIGLHSVLLPLLITDGTFITLAWVKMLLQKRPLLRLGPVITLVPSTPVRLVRWKWKCLNDGALFLCAR